MSEENFIYEFRTRRVRRSMAGERRVGIYHRVFCSDDIARCVNRILDGESRETILAFFLDIRNKVIGYEVVSIGTLTGVDVHPRDVFRTAILASAAAIVLAHNHPSGDPTPSDDDRALTTRMMEVGELMGIPVIDHVIVGDESHYSITEEKKL